MIFQKCVGNKFNITLMSVLLVYTVFFIFFLIDGKSKKTIIAKQIKLNYLAKNLRTCTYPLQNVTLTNIKNSGNQSQIKPSSIISE